MIDTLTLIALGLISLFVAVTVMRLLAEGRGSQAATASALERTRESLAQEIRSSDGATQSAVTQALGILGQQLSGEVQGGRRDQTEALAEQGRLLSESRERQSADLQSTRSEVRDRLDALQKSQGETLDTFGGRVERALTEARQEQSQALASGQQALATALEGHGRTLSQTTASIHEQLSQTREAQHTAAKDVAMQVATQLEAMRKDNEQKLELIRATVDEKLHATLENRLGESFKLVSERLETLHQGLGEVQALAGDVGDLKRVLSNVRARGSFGEIQLEVLIADFLTPEQYSRNVVTVPGATERVEFAIHLPSSETDGKPVYLPIDAKFPLEDYRRFQDALEAGDQAAAASARNALRQRLLQEAETIRRKYLAPPATAEYALLFLPSESLFAEVLRIPGVQEELQRRNVMAVGPTNLQALLASYQLGLRTLAIQKRSAEVWRVLGAVKTEFGKFGDAIGAVSDKLGQAQRKLDDVGTRTRALSRKLRTVHELPEEEAARLIDEPPVEAHALAE